MKILDIKYVDDKLLNSESVKDEVLFLNSDECRFIYEASNGNITTVENWFKVIGIKHDNIYFTGKFLVYRKDGVDLTLPDLSSGERFVLYLLACKEVGRKVIALSLLERLGGRLEHIVYNEFKDDDFLTIITYNFIVSPDFKYLCVKEV